MMQKIVYKSAVASSLVVLASFLTACGGGLSTPTFTSPSSSSSSSVEASSSSSSAASVVAVENSGADCDVAAIPDYADLTVEVDGLPDPFVSMSGERITEKSDWTCRRAEIGAQAQKYELGEKPAAPTSVTGSLNGDTLTVTMEMDGETLSFDAVITLPTGGEPPYPAMIGMGGVSLNRTALSNMGVAIISFPNNQVAQQNGGVSRGIGSFYDFYGDDHTAGAMMAWSWGVSRLIDALETTEGTQINAMKLGMTGCSRNGKGAIIAGAFDERIALTIGQESGSGGAAGWRVSDAQLASGQNVQTLRQIVGENVWFTSSFSDFSESANLLPYDHHAVMGMIAPRGLLIIENDIDWLGVDSTYVTSVVAREIWKAQGIADNMGVSQTVAHQHCAQPASQQVEITAFVQKFLFDDDSANTNVVKNEVGVVVDWDRWLNWTTPELN